MADYPLPNPQLPFGQQAVSPVAQTNPLMSLQQGGVQGFSLGLQARQQAMLQQQQQREAAEQQQRMELAQREQENKDFQSFGVAIKNLKAIPSAIKGHYWDNIVVPYGKKVGLDIGPGYDPSTDDQITTDAAALFDHHKKDPKSFTKDDVIGGLQLLAMKAQDAGQEEQAKTLMDIAKDQSSASKVSSFMRPISRVSDSGNPLYFSAQEGYMEADPETGGYKPYTGKQMPMASNPSTGAETDLRDVIQQRSLIDESLSKITPDKVGLINKKWKDVGTYMDQSTDPEAVYFRSITELANTMIRYKYYGATLTNNEKKAFDQIAANRNLSPQAFMAQVKAMKFTMDKVENSIKNASAQANRPFVNSGNKPVAGEDLSTMSDEELQAIISGKK